MRIRVVVLNGGEIEQISISKDKRGGQISGGDGVVGNFVGIDCAVCYVLRGDCFVFYLFSGYSLIVYLASGDS